MLVHTSRSVLLLSRFAVAVAIAGCASGPQPGQGPTTRIMRCGTGTDRQVECKTRGYATNVRLARDLSGNQCRQGSNWGSTDSFIWANKGCRGEFEVTYAGTSPAPRPPPGSYPTAP